MNNLGGCCSATFVRRPFHRVCGPPARSPLGKVVQATLHCIMAALLLEHTGGKSHIGLRKHVSAHEPGTTRNSGSPSRGPVASPAASPATSPQPRCRPNSTPMRSSTGLGVAIQYQRLIQRISIEAPPSSWCPRRAPPVSALDPADLHRGTSLVMVPAAGSAGTNA